MKRHGSENEELLLGERRIAFIVRQGSLRRKRIALRVRRDCVVEVLVPPRLARAKAIEALLSCKAWVLRHLDAMASCSVPDEAMPEYIEEASQPKRDPVSSIRCWHVGRAYHVHVLPQETVCCTAHAHPSVTLCPDAGVLYVRLAAASSKQIQAVLARWQRKQAESLFSARVHALSHAISWLQEVPPLRLRMMRRRWGSCSRHGVITMNVRLIGTPVRCIDYVLLHEMAHLREYNHSKQYYRLLETLMPDWKDVRYELERYAAVVLP